MKAFVSSDCWSEFVDNDHSEKRGDSLNGCCYVQVRVANNLQHSHKNARDCPEDLNK